MKEKYSDINSKTIDNWVEHGWEWGVPIVHEDYIKATKGEWKMFLTPTKPVPKDWFCKLKGAKVLGLASGGAQQMPIFAAEGAICTVLDYSQKQIDSEIAMAQKEGYEINAIRADMTQKLPFEDESFDLIFHPVSNCYIEDVQHVWNECYRVLKKGGTLLSGLDNGINFVFDDEEVNFKYKLPFNPLKDEVLYKDSIENNWGMQFSHNIDEQIGGQLKAGFMLNDVFSDTNGVGNLHEHNVASFYATKSTKI